jgi:hypothetical protein
LFPETRLIFSEFVSLLFTTETDANVRGNCTFFFYSGYWNWHFIFGQDYFGIAYG